MSAKSTGVTRPVGVTVIAVLAWISGLSHVIGGVWLLFNLVLVGDIWQATLEIFIGAVTILVGMTLLQGNPLGRVVATVVLVLSIVASVFGVFLQPIGPLWFGALTGGLLAIVGVILLWTRSASTFFRNA